MIIIIYYMYVVVIWSFSEIVATQVAPFTKMVQL